MNIRAKSCFYRLLLFVLIFFIVAGPTAPLLAQATPPASEEETTIPWQPVVNTKQEAYYVIDRDRGSVLFEKNADTVRQAPLAVNIMLVLLTLETTDISIPLTISEEVAARSARENILAMQLTAGQKYDISYLLHCLMFYDSRAAAQALIENLTDSRETLLENMSQRARALGMADTAYLAFGSADIRANSTLSDLSLLLTQALASSTFNQIFRSRSDIFTQNMPRASFIENRMKYAWSYSDGTFAGSALAKDTYNYTIAYLVSGPNYPILILQSSSFAPNAKDAELIIPALQEAMTVSDAVYAGYERTLLVSEGEHYKTIVQQDGLSVRLVYLDTVYFLKPTGDVVFDPELQASVPTNIPLPIVEGETLGRITFVMPDQSRYVVDVGSDQDLLANNTMLEQFLISIKNYPQILTLVFILLGLVLLLLLVKVILFIRRSITFRRQSYPRDRRNRR